MRWQLNAEKGDELFTDEFGLPSQLAERTRSAMFPELRLLAAVLEDALQCVFGGTRGREFLETCEWFLADRRDWPFSFANVCEELGLDARAVRKRLQPILKRRAAVCRPLSARESKFPR